MWNKTLPSTPPSYGQSPQKGSIYKCITFSRSRAGLGWRILWCMKDQPILLAAPGGLLAYVTWSPSQVVVFRSCFCPQASPGLQEACIRC